MKKFTWQKIGFNTWRARVHRGWIVALEMEDSTSMVFIEDPTFNWELEPYENPKT